MVMNSQFIPTIRISLNQLGELLGVVAKIGNIQKLVEVEVLVKNVEAARLAEETADDAELTFDVAVSLVESENKAGQFTLKYDINITSQPAVAKMAVSGTARITGEQSEIESVLKTSDSNDPPPVFMTIYQKVYAILYLLSGSLKIPYPSPGLMKIVRRVASPEAFQENGRDQGPPAISRRA
jgi:hypothetical protein